MLFFVAFFCFFLAGRVYGDTEIVNFDSKETCEDLSRELSWPTLSWNNSHIILHKESAASTDVLQECQNLAWSSDLSIQPCRHELWLALDLDEDPWRKYHKFTLRVSWPAFHPTRVGFSIQDPPFANISSASSCKTPRRRQYAKITLLHTGVLTPNPTVDPKLVADRYKVDLFITLEPLYLGVLPASVLPVVLAILGVVLVGIPVSRRIHVALQGIVEPLRREIAPPLRVQSPGLPTAARPGPKMRMD